MSNSNTNLQTQSSNALYNAIMEMGSKDRPPMLAPVPVAEGSFETTTERYMENYKNVSQDIRDQLNAEAEAVEMWKDDTDDESDDQELEAHYMYMAQIQEVTPDLIDNSGPIFDAEPLHKVHNNNDNYNVFAIENENPEQPESVNDIYLEEQGDTN
ncbi:hypothetical protein Tco_0457910, partial [Tanacetum coccineum]